MVDVSASVNLPLHHKVHMNVTPAPAISSFNRPTHGTLKTENNNKKSRSSLLALAHPGGPGKRAIKRLW